MKFIFAILFSAALFVGCGTRQSEVSSKAAALAGSYHRGDGLGYNIHLDLLATGAYEAEWHGCLGVYGTARGKWTLVDDRVILSPVDETGMMKGHLSELHVVPYQGQQVFVPDLHDDYYLEYGPNEYAAFHRQVKR